MSHSSKPHLRSPGSTLKYRARHRPIPQHPDLAVPEPSRFQRIAQSKLPLVVACTVGGIGVAYSVLLYKGYTREVERNKTLDVPIDVSDRYKYNASRFDADISSSEYWLGINRRRQQLCEKATGHVLEVSAGTGRNSEYLPLDKRKIKTVTLADKHREMIDEARRKWPEQGNAWFIRTSFYIKDCTEKIPCPQPEGFDTIIQTMGLCSTPEPEKLLRNLGEMTNPKGGQILLLEHGLGKYQWVNRIIENLAPAHADRYGCWWNKDVGEIVRRSGLEVVEEKRFNFGTTWWFVLRPKKQPESQS